jgi:transposase-like protein
VRLIKERGVSYVQASQDLGVHVSQLRDWVKKFPDETKRELMYSPPEGRTNQWRAQHDFEIQEIAEFWVPSTEIGHLLF